MLHFCGVGRAAGFKATSHATSECLASTYQLTKICPFLFKPIDVVTIRKKLVWRKQYCVITARKRYPSSATRLQR